MSTIEVLNVTEWLEVYKEPQFELVAPEEPWYNPFVSEIERLRDKSYFAVGDKVIFESHMATITGFDENQIHVYVIYDDKSSGRVQANLLTQIEVEVDIEAELEDVTRLIDSGGY